MPLAMAAPFPPWCDSVLRVALVGIIVGAIAVPSTLMAWVRSPLSTGQYQALQQPITFDHRHHVQDVGLDCAYCHYLARRSAYAGVPETALCYGCHQQVHADSPQVAPILKSMNEASPIIYNRVHDLPDFVFFDHSVHIEASVGCESCHGRVDQMSAVRQEAPLTMAWCLDCHRNPGPALRPRSEVTTMGYRGPAVASLSTSEVNPPTHCSGCHR